MHDFVEPTARVVNLFTVALTHSGGSFLFEGFRGVAIFDQRNTLGKTPWRVF